MGFNHVSDAVCLTQNSRTDADKHKNYNHRQNKVKTKQQPIFHKF